MISFEQVSVHYGDVCALENVTFSLEPGRLCALVGQNGSGKTTLLKTVCGLVTPSSGSLTLDGAPINLREGRVAYLPQRDSVDWSFPSTVRGVVEMGRFPRLGWFRGYSGKDREMVGRAMAQMELEDLQDRPIHALSGGQQQRTFIARALAQEADVLLMDEAFNGLDYPTQENLQEIFSGIADAGKLVVVSHHDLKTLPDYFSEAIILNRELLHCGKVEEDDFPKLLKEAGLRG